MTPTDSHLQRRIDRAVRQQLDIRLQEVFELGADELCGRAHQFTDMSSTGGGTSWISEAGSVAEPPLGLDFRKLLFAIAETFAHMAVAAETAEPVESEIVETEPLTQGVDLPSTLAELQEHSLSTQEAAALLGVNTSRVRQRLLGRTLYGFKDGPNWWVPKFQFEGHRTLPGAGRVFREIDAAVSPLTVARWFVLPWEDLVVDEDLEIVASPRTWLLEGRDPEPVAEQARVL